MRIIVTGRQGQVVQSLLDRCNGSDVEIICLGRPELDLRYPAGVQSAIAAARPDVVISAAAYTAVDKAESEAVEARTVNALGAGTVAKAAKLIDVPVLHLSTDYVFSGGGERPYREEDETGPLSVYGRTKLEGEIAVQQANSRHVILRTTWVYSPFGQNFVKTMLQLAQTRSQIDVVADQIGCPTSALDIADVLLQVARRVVGVASETSPYYGIFHIASQGEGSWADLAEAVFKESERCGGPSAKVNRVSTAAFPRPAKRPANSRLDASKLEAI